MLKSIKKLIKKSDKKPEGGELELKLAAATLMFEVIRSDGRVDKVELIYMGEILRREFKLNEEELEELFKQAKDTAHEATSLQGFTREICDQWGSTKRMKLLEYLWMLALADDQIDPHERHLVRKVAGLLYLNEKQIVQSRERAKQQLGMQ
ncbi:TerB family tellurite resistance protein [Arenicella xantha]|uniref:Putative tellurite resistance protein B-like protein n=1 Tax=Arenicella xantha TaxID=644221 RepID=A0A395JGD2_9GAMM|nr:TerB family tellurite resistance protein [Arenicella xantha]RBP48431.1 putative tellurite resistance protein B-like protein [Arenicella xantha]